MSMKEDIVRILEEYRDKHHDGNSDRAARSLGVAPPTFWRWLNKVNVPKVETLAPVFDLLQAKIVLPNDNLPPQTSLTDNEKDALIAALETERQELLQQINQLQQYKAKWEGALEMERARAGLEPTTKKAAG